MAASNTPPPSAPGLGPGEPRANLPFTGIASFAKLPIATDLATL